MSDDSRDTDAEARIAPAGVPVHRGYFAEAKLGSPEASLKGRLAMHPGTL